MANMNMVIHDMDGVIEIGDTMGTPKFKEKNKLRKFDLVTANPMWNQSTFDQKTYENDELERFPAGYSSQWNGRLGMGAAHACFNE